jgi:hypothetical protein
LAIDPFGELPSALVEILKRMKGQSLFDLELLPAGPPAREDFRSSASGRVRLRRIAISAAPAIMGRVARLSILPHQLCIRDCTDLEFYEMLCAGAR